MIPTAPAFAVTVQVSNHCNNFHKGIFKAVETVHDRESLGLFDEQGIARVHGRLFWKSVA